MNFLLKQILKTTTKNSSRPTAQMMDENFIPYVCHFDPHTILTKNGELLCVIRVTGFSANSAASELISLRQAVRMAIIDNVKETKFALWFNTIRRKKNIAPKGDFPDFFSQKINEEWVKENSWDDQYVNELYITIITEGLDTSIANFKGFLGSFSYLATKSMHSNFLNESQKKLEKLTKTILRELKDYGAKMLGIADWEGVLYSEPMRFFGKIVNLYEARYPLSVNDLSSELASHKIAFGDRELEVIGDHNKNFAAMFSLKEYLEIPAEALDRVLQLPFEFIITQSFDFAFSRKELEQYEYQDYILKVSGDEELRQASGIAEFVESNKNLPTDFGRLQTTMMLIGPDHQELEKDVASAVEQFCALGLVLVREDIFLEHCFWSQLPGNFSFLRRQKPINSKSVAGFASLQSFPSGSIAGNHWGPAVTTFNTALGTPYFFNFHDGISGHTLVLGPHDSGKTSLVNFLLCQARKFENKIFYIDFNSAAKCFFKALQGKYYSLSLSLDLGMESLRLNPFAKGISVNDKAMLVDFFNSLVAFAKEPLPMQEIDFIPEIIDRMIASKPSNFEAACESFNVAETAKIYEKLKVWNGESLKKTFGNDGEIDFSDKIIACDLTEVANQKAVMIPIINYLLRRVEESLDGSESILVLNEAWSFLDSPVIAPKIHDFLERLKQKNCVVIFTSSDVEHVEKSAISEEIAKNTSLKIFLSNPQPNDCYEKIFGLDEEESEIIAMLDSEERHFLLKRAEDAIIATFELNKFPQFLKIFSADETTIVAMEETISHVKEKLGEDVKPKDWLPEFFEVLREIEKEKEVAKKQKLREEAAEKRRALKAKLASSA